MQRDQMLQYLFDEVQAQVHKAEQVLKGGVPRRAGVPIAAPS